MTHFVDRTLPRLLALVLLFACTACATTASDAERTRPVRFAVISDVHHGLAPDALGRLEHFVAAVNARRDTLDFAIQLGDFCLAKEGAQQCIDAWNRLDVPAYHVLGNHDFDLADPAIVMDLFGMDANTYSFDVAGWHFVVLDLNHLHDEGADEPRVAYANSNYYIEREKRAWIDEEDLAWLRADLAATALPTVVFSHQPLGVPWQPGEELPPQQREVLDALLAPGSAPVALCINGHEHCDRLAWYGDLACLTINSASYYWSRGMHPYRDALYAFVTLHPDGRVTVEGVESDWLDEETDLPEDRPWMRPGIADRDFRLPRVEPARGD